MSKITKKKLLNALNRMDEFASEATRDNDNGEAQKLEKDYNMLFDFISKADFGEKKKENQKLDIPFSENDIQDLQAGESFDWTFETDQGESIDIHLRPETDEDNEI